MKKYFGSEWTLRVYFQMPKSSPQWDRLCNLKCSDPQIDICDIEKNPRFDNLASVFPLNWRFLPSMDSQVDALFVRDLDSEISEREMAAVEEFLESDKDFHVMRDHPQHGTVILGETVFSASSVTRIIFRKSPHFF